METRIYEYEPGKCLTLDINSNKVICNHYILIKSVWDMHMRYQRTKVTRADARAQMTAYREFAKWILKNY